MCQQISINYGSTSFKYNQPTITFNIAATGTAKSIPHIPTSFPPANKANTTTKGWSPNLSPIILGVMRLLSSVAL